jgi:hypothetical protein
VVFPEISAYLPLGYFEYIRYPGFIQLIFPHPLPPSQELAGRSFALPPCRKYSVF